MGQSYDTGGALRCPPEAPAGGAAALFVAAFGSVVHALLGLVIFAGLVIYDFRRLRVTNEIDSGRLLAVSISSTSSTSSTSSSSSSVFARSRN
jgi:hypothetical protein